MAIAGVEPAGLSQKQGPKDWSPNEVLAHIRAAADVHGKTIGAILASENLAMRYLSPRTWIRKTNHLALGFDVSFDAYTTQRAALLATLRGLTPDDWSRTVTYTGATRGAEQTILDVAGGLARHEAVHCDQIAALLL